MTLLLPRDPWTGRPQLEGWGGEMEEPSLTRWSKRWGWGWETWHFIAEFCSRPREARPNRHGGPSTFLTATSFPHTGTEATWFHLSSEQGRECGKSGGGWGIKNRKEVR